MRVRRIQIGLALLLILFLSCSLYGEVKPIGFAISFPDIILPSLPSKGGSNLSWDFTQKEISNQGLTWRVVSH